MSTLNWSEFDKDGSRRDARMQRRLVEQHQREATAAPAEAPGVGVVVLVTALFGLFGLIPMFSAMDRARKAGQPTGSYVAAFVVTLVVMSLVAFVLLF